MVCVEGNQHLSDFQTDPEHMIIPSCYQHCMEDFCPREWALATTGPA